MRFIAALTMSASMFLGSIQGLAQAEEWPGWPELPTRSAVWTCKSGDSVEFTAFAGDDLDSVWWYSFPDLVEFEVITDREFDWSLDQTGDWPIPDKVSLNGEMPIYPNGWQPYPGIVRLTVSLRIDGSRGRLSITTINEEFIQTSRSIPLRCRRGFR